MYSFTLRIAAATIAVLITVSTASAALVCGAVQMRYFGITDKNFRLAKNWARLLPHTTAHEGAVVVQHRNGRDSAGRSGGHVSRIIAMRDNCTALVADEKGQYERDICRGLIAYVNPTDGNGNRVAKVERTRTQYSAKQRRYARTASTRQATFVPQDRMMIH